MRTKPRILILLSALAAVIGVYVMLGGLGNNWSFFSSPDAVASTEHNCSLSQAQRTDLDNAAQGDVAGMRLLDKAIDVKAVAFNDRDGNGKTIADYRGKKLFLHLWATWCPPCRDEMPLVEQLHMEKKDAGLVVLPVSIDLGDDLLPKAFYEQTGLKQLPFFHDGTMESFNILRKNAIALGMPTTLLINEAGCGIAVLSGPAHWNSADSYALMDVFLSDRL